ncbi:MAG: WbqC family protein [Planctomycetaceae bacterium]
MRLAIMQPYFLPYVGYFQLIAAADVFVVYNNIQFTKKGWINRNRFLLNGSDAVFSVPVKKDSDFLNVDQRDLADSFSRTKLSNQLQEAYRRAPQFAVAWPVIEAVIFCPHVNLFQYVRHSLDVICDYLSLTTPLVNSSDVPVDHSLPGQQKVLAICQSLNATTYINAIGGQSLYAAQDFRARGIQLQFLKSQPSEYPQFKDPFVPWLSIVDVMMFNDVHQIQSMLRNVTFV